MKRSVIVFLSFVFSLATFIEFASCQIKVESIQLPGSILSAPQWQQDQYRLETAVKAAAAAAKQQNRNVTVFLSSGKLTRKSPSNGSSDPSASPYEFKPKIYRLRRPLLIPGGVVLAGEGLGRRESRLVWEDCNSNSALLIFRDGFGGGLQNVDIRLGANLQSKKNVTALYLHSQSSAVFKDFAIDLSNIGSDSNGIVLARNKTNNESLKFENFNIRAARPVIVMSGDNLIFENFDCNCSSPVTDGVSAVFQNWDGNVPDNWTIGPGSGQKGDHAIAFTGTTNRTGDSLTIIGYRWEQGTTKGPAWLFDVVRKSRSAGSRSHFLESLTMINCRNALQLKNPDYVSIRLPEDSYLSADFIGGFLPGKKEIGNPKGKKSRTAKDNSNFRKD